MKREKFFSCSFFSFPSPQTQTNKVLFCTQHRRMAVLEARKNFFVYVSLFEAIHCFEDYLWFLEFFNWNISLPSVPSYAYKNCSIHTGRIIDLQNWTQFRGRMSIITRYTLNFLATNVTIDDSFLDALQHNCSMSSIHSWNDWMYDFN